jgi:hypothetical protein
MNNSLRRFALIATTLGLALATVVAAPAAAKPSKPLSEARAVQAKAQAMWSTKPALPPIEVTYAVQDRVMETQWAKDSLGAVDAALRLSVGLGIPLPEDQHVVLAWDADWAVAQLPDDDGITCLSWIRGAMGGYCGLGYNLAQFEAFAKSWGYGDMNVYRTPEQALIMAGNIPHEFGHAVQGAVAQDNPAHDWRLVPAWLREGGPEVFKVLAYAESQGLSYLKARANYSGLNPRCRSIPLTQLSGTGTTSSYCEYDKGMLAVEYLIARTGRLSAPFDFFRATGSTTAEIFRDAYGLDLADFLKKANAYANRQMR